MINFFDLLQDNNGLVVNSLTNDFVISESDNRHIEDIIVSNKGEWKQYPSLGVGIDLELNGDGNKQKIVRDILLQLQGDGYIVEKPKIKFDNLGKLEITPNAFRE
jgi:hypothetical protein